MKNSQDIIQQLSDVPLLLLDATEKWRFFPRDEHLRAAVEHFCHTVVNSITALIYVLLRKHETVNRSCKSNQQSSNQGGSTDDNQCTSTGQSEGSSLVSSRGLQSDRRCK